MSTRFFGYSISKFTNNGISVNVFETLPLSAKEKKMSHTCRLQFFLIIYLPICLSHETQGRGPLKVGGPGSLNLLNPLLLRHWC